MEKIGLWMYNNDGGHLVQKKLKIMLEKKGYEVVNNFDMRKCYCKNNKVFSENGYDLTQLGTLFHMNADERNAHQDDILMALSLSGVKLINPYRAYSTARDKFTTNWILRANNIPVPPSLLIGKNFNEEVVKKVFADWKEVLIKPRREHAGCGIIKINNYENFYDFCSSVKEFVYQYYIEKFIQFKEHDYRIEIINNQIVGGYSRTKNHTFKTNIKYGGMIIASPDNEEFKKTAIAAAKALNISTTIVDMIKSTENNQIYVLEVNDSIGVFVEAALKEGVATAMNGTSDIFSYDDKKLEMLVNYIIQS